MKYSPIRNSATLEIVQNNQIASFSSFDNKVYRDPKNQLSPRVYKVIRAEKTLKLTLAIIWLFLMLVSIISFTVVYTNILPMLFTRENVGYLVLFGLVAIVSFFACIKNLIENSTWNHTIQRYRDAVQVGDYTSSNTFHLAYRRIVLKGVNLTWMLVFVLTYYGLFTLIVYGLFVSGTWTFGIDKETKIVSVIAINLDWKSWLTKAFGNVNWFTIINVLIMGSLIAAFVTMKLIDKKRLADLDDFLGEKSVELHNQIETSKKDRNKMWMKIYLVVVILTILLPLALILIAIWKGILRRKKSVSI
ncbi:MSC_0882 family membrane protein [Mycoplasmopsis hyopharyngis]|uniref:MSC_0882 family membrane protein n=1 Tax=Mycoplasmopsis hyopharyngis TaxID=29558 RepID=UPI00387344E3